MKIGSFFITLISFFIIGCGSNHSTGPSTSEPKDAILSMDIGLNRVAALAKTSAINLRIVKFTLSSSLGDTIHDSVSASGSEQVVISKEFRIKSLRSWSISARSYDTNDSLIHSGKSGSVYIRAADTVKMQLSMGSRFSMYQANFLSIPDSVALSQGQGNSHSKHKIVISRLVLKIGGKIRVDSVGSFNPGQLVSLNFDYIPAGTQTVVMEAYGNMPGNGNGLGFQGLLFSGSVVFSNIAGTDETKSIALDWKGPGNQMNGSFVTLGRVGKNKVNGTMEFTQAD